MDTFNNHLNALKAKFPDANLERRPDGSAVIRIPNFPLPPGWSKTSTMVLFVVLSAYPQAKPDGFWADADLRLASGVLPANSTPNNNYGGVEQLLWFSWHANSWNQNLDDFLTYAMVIRRRFLEA